MGKPGSKPLPRQPPKRAGAPDPVREYVFLLAAGGWVGLSLLKFGNPVILDRMVGRPVNGLELVFQPWPFAWGCGVSLLVMVAGFFAVRKFQVTPPKWLFWLPLAWLGWQILAGARTVAPHLTNITLVHFGITVLAFYLGCLALGKTRRMGLFWMPVLLAFAWVLLQGFDQHYGGLEATRQAFYEQENWREYPPEYLLKLSTNRIFSTLVYPNALAGAILLFGPVLFYQLWRLSAGWPKVVQGVVCGIFGYMALACLYWTGSKGGWLIALVMCGVLLLQLPGGKKLKVAAVTLVAVVGLGAFFIKFSSYFQRGAPSVGARFTYWSAAWQTALEHPVLGTGPGTFAVAYAKIKPEGAEMARLAHNDYLEQASDSGWAGFLLYGSFVTGVVFWLYRKSWSQGWEFRLILVGLLGWALQGFIEFGLYIPALAWPAFLLFGWGLKVVDAPMDTGKAA